MSNNGNPASNPSRPANRGVVDPYEEDLVTWLQYPMEDSLEKSYCSDLFGHWPSVSVARTTSLDRADAGLAGVPPANLGTCFERSASTMAGTEAISRSVSGGHLMAGSPTGTGHTVCNAGSASLMRSTSAQGALALGAERAAGLVPQAGLEAFSKVRTSRQPPQASSFSSMKIPTRSERSAASLSARLSEPTNSKQLCAQPSKVGLPDLSNSSHILASLSMHSSKTGQANSLSVDDRSAASTSSISMSSHALPCERSGKFSGAQLQLSSARQQSGCSLVTEEASLRRACDYSSNASSRGQSCTMPVGANFSGRLESTRVECPTGSGKWAGVCTRSDSGFVSRSGGSQTSADLSTKEAASSGKRKLEDSDCQSEDPDDEFMDSKPTRKSSSSKRNRAAEVHNLSEKRRRSRINEKMKALQELIPNSSKTDKASMLEEAIEYMKTLQLQLQMVSMRSGLNPMMIPTAIPQLQMAQMAPLHPVGLGVPLGHAGMGMGMPMGMNMNINMNMGTSPGMGMVDLSQGVVGRPFHTAASTMNQFGMQYHGAATINAQNCSQTFVNIDVTPAEPPTFQQDVQQVSNQLQIGAQSFQPQHQHHPTLHSHGTMESSDGQVDFDTLQSASSSACTWSRSIMLFLSHWLCSRKASNGQLAAKSCYDQPM